MMQGHSEPGGGKGAGAAQGSPRGWGLGEGASRRVGGVLPAWDFICTLGKGVGEPQEPALCPASLGWGERLDGISTHRAAG